MIRKYTYNPDYAVLPGVTLSETLHGLCMKQSELAQRAGRPLKTINQIIKGKTSITADTAIQFEKVLGVPAAFWLKLEQNYQEKTARLKEEETLHSQQRWLVDVPLAAMIKYCWISGHTDRSQQLQEVLKFFGVAHFSQIKTTASGQIAFRKSVKVSVDKWALAAWLRKGELDAKVVKCDGFDRNAFTAALPAIKALTTDDKNNETWNKLAGLCAQCGVALVFVRELPGLPVNGATYWLKDKPVIQLSLRYKLNDVLWFTFFHEAGHILKHGKKDIFVEMNEDKAVKELDADRFAADYLMPGKKYDEFKTSGVYCEHTVKQFATTLGIAPGIVVGRLQHDKKIPFSKLNHLKVRFRWVD